MSARLKTAAPRATRENTAIFEYVSTPLNFRFYVTDQYQSDKNKSS